MAKPKWIDTHIHVSDIGADGARRKHLLEDIIEALDRADADLRLVISVDGYWNCVVKEEEEGVIRANAFIHELVRGAPDRLYGSCIVNPNFLEMSLKTMEICFEQGGFVQLGEMLQYMMDYKMNSDATEELVRRAAAYDVPIQVHISTSNAGVHPSSFGSRQLEDLFGLVERVPEAKYVLAHAVGMPADNPPVVDGYLDMIEARCKEWPRNFWVEIRDFNSPGVRSALARVPADRLMSGTDWTTRVGPPFLPYGTLFNVKSGEENPYPPCVASIIRFLREFGAADEVISKIAFENAAALLRLR